MVYPPRRGPRASTTRDACTPRPLRPGRPGERARPTNPSTRSAPADLAVRVPRAPATHSAPRTSSRWPATLHAAAAATAPRPLRLWRVPPRAANREWAQPFNPRKSRGQTRTGHGTREEEREDENTFAHLHDPRPTFLFQNSLLSCLFGGREGCHFCVTRPACTPQSSTVYPSHTATTPHTSGHSASHYSHRWA